MFGKIIHRYIYLISLAGIGLSLPLSEFSTSVFTISLAANWLVEMNPVKRDWQSDRIKPLLIFISLFAIYLIWMLNTGNLDSGIDKLRLKLPILLIPLVISTSGEIKEREIRLILSTFLAGVLIASLAGVLNYFVISDSLSDRREISLYISHIRLSLMVCLSVFISGYEAIKLKKRRWKLIPLEF